MRRLIIIFYLSMLIVLVSACARPPYINAIYVGKGNPQPLPQSAEIEVYLEETPPEKPYEIIGKVEITTERKKRTLDNMIGYAKREAQKMGGDALINVKLSTHSGGSQTVRNLYTGKAMYNTAVIVRIVTANVVKWK